MSKAATDAREKFNRELVECLSGIYNFEIEYIQPWHLRLKMDRMDLDYFPKHGKSTVVGSGKWFTIKNIENYITNLYEQHC